MSASTAIAPSDLVKREVYYCVSSLIDALAKIENNDWSDDVRSVLYCDDYLSAATDNGYEGNDSDEAREFCEENRIDPYEEEAYEHWIVSDWLARKLSAYGEMTAEVMGMTVWGRTCTGQAICMDWVIQQICNDLNSRED